MRLKGRVIGVTGSATGIGEGLARVFVRAGARAIGMAGVTVAARLIAETMEYYGTGSCRRSCHQRIWLALPVYLSGETALVNGATLDFEPYPVVGRDPPKQI